MSPRSGDTRSSSTSAPPTLGGQVLVAARAPLRPGYGQSVEWLVRQLQKTSATVRLGTEATVERVLADRPDAVVVATGAVPRRPAVPGADLPGVATVEEILSGAVVAGPRVVVVDGTGRVQAGLAADFLAVQGRAVTVLTAYHTVCDNTEGSTKEPLYERLYQRDVKMLVDTAFVGRSSPTVPASSVCGRPTSTPTGRSRSTASTRSSSPTAGAPSTGSTPLSRGASRK